VVYQLFGHTRLAARNSRLSLAEAILTDYYQDIMAQNVALRSLRKLGYTEQQARRMLDRARALRSVIQ
jgi:hypothetical protein